MTPACTRGPVSPFTCTKASSGFYRLLLPLLASVPDCAGKCRIVRGLFVGDAAADPDLRPIFVGTRAAQEAVVLDAAPGG